MEGQQTLFKGELMEELLRNYFQSMGYFVVRGLKLKLETNDLTDIDLFLYKRSSILTRERINVDIKNKQRPQSFERIVWANGLMKILSFDSCIVATTDSRPLVQTFAKTYQTIVFDGNFLNKLKPNLNPNRISEEDLLNELSKSFSYKKFPNRDWKYIYELSKSKVLSELDYSGFNSSLFVIFYFIEKSLTDPQKKNISLRMTYILISHILIILDFIVKDIAFLEQLDRERRLSDGFKFGNLGKEGIDKIISVVSHISGSKSASMINKSLENVPTDILKQYFSKQEVISNLFLWAKEFESLGFSKSLLNPHKLESNLRGVISILLDFAGIERKKYFDSFSISEVIK